jgi:hypothetical protein
MSVEPERTNYKERIRSGFARQGLMRTLRATLGDISPGLVEIAMRPDLA